MNDRDAPKSRGATCPVCRKHPAAADYRPFCSRRCADVDLSRWLGGVYRIEDDTEAPPMPLDEIDEN